MKPKKLYRLAVKQGDGKPFRYGEQGGKTFAALGHAMNARDHHRRLGREATLFVTECNWEEIE